TVELQGHLRLCELLSHLYVLVPVLDDDKHYWVSEEEITKLLRHGTGWLVSHPEREAITHRYLKRQRRLTKTALMQLVEADTPELERAEATQGLQEVAIEARMSLNQHRLDAVVAMLKQRDVKRVVDLGCGEGKLLKRLLNDITFEQVTGMDVSHQALAMAQSRLQVDNLPEKVRSRLQLIQGSLTYRDQRLAGYDAATVIEVIEHLDPHRLTTFERVLFEFARPRVVILTTPNVEYNVKFETLPAGQFRHSDHRFEWTRMEFQSWTHRVAIDYGYTVQVLPIGANDPIVGAPTQMGIFTCN
ncbi:MAG: 3' terminal RNA ribose 2'-O-methyltransferase Hen1, partial [Cyanothece sp. SIO1E1]|nr:3' terminal RNA ribose 2'-O-methyltransferase Hen1 [Cyanothece sp. SIO1E1]